MVLLHPFWSFKSPVPIHCHCIKKSEYYSKCCLFVFHRIKKWIRVNEWWQFSFLLNSASVFHMICYWCDTVSGLYLTSAVLINMNVWFANTAQLELTADFLRLEQIFIFRSYSLYSNRGNCNVNGAPLKCIIAYIRAHSIIHWYFYVWMILEYSGWNCFWPC